MPFWPWKRKSTRLPDYDYTQEGAYFITVCTTKREGLLGKIGEGVLQLNDAGKMVEKWWLKLASKFPLIKVDPFYVVMPNHFHGILLKFIEVPGGAHMGAPLQEMMQWFKNMSTNEYIHGVREYGWPDFKGKLWQRSFHDHVIRSEESLHRVREYIANNPKRWEIDRENPRAQGKDEFDVWLTTFTARPAAGLCRGAPMCAPSTRRQLGDAGEDLAAAALKKQGYKILERNYTAPMGEIDLVARHQGTLVFIEVKTRQSVKFGEPQEAVNPAKQARLRKLADYYLKQQRLGEVAVRFDVAAVTMNAGAPSVQVIRDAF
jgi:putative transposase